MNPKFQPINCYLGKNYQNKLVKARKFEKKDEDSKKDTKVGDICDNRT